jgi:hypothetical protein
MDNPVNRPSVIVFHSSTGEIDNANDNDIEVLYDSGDNVDSTFNDDLVSNQFLLEREDQYPDEVFPEGIYEEEELEELPIHEYISMQPSTTRPAAISDILYESVDTIINPDVYRHQSSQDFHETFRELYQTIFDNVVRKVTSENPNQFKSVSVCLQSDGFDTPVNLQFVPIDRLSSELFLIMLYNFLQSKRDIITTNEMKLGFTFYKYILRQQ